MNQPEDLNQNEELFPDLEQDEFEMELKQALRHVNAPAGFAQRIVERAQLAEPAHAIPARAKVIAMPRLRAWTNLWAGGAIAASLLAGVLVTDQVHVRR